MKNKLKERITSILLSLCLIAGALGGMLAPTISASAEGTTDEVTQVLYVAGSETGSDENDGSSADQALATLGAAYAKIPTDNIKTVIVVTDAVNATEGATVVSNQFYYFALSAGAKSHVGEVVITSAYGEEDYRDSASLSFGNKIWFFIGDTTFENIKITNKANILLMNYYSLHLGQGVEGTFANTLYGGTMSDIASYRNVQDIEIMVESGIITTLYGGGASWQGKGTVAKNNSITINVSGGEITKLCGTGLGGTDNAHQKSITINVSGGKVSALYGADKTSTVYEDVTINLTGGEVSELYGACKWTQGTSTPVYIPTIKGNVVINLGSGATVTNLYGMEADSNVVGDTILHYSNEENVTVGNASNFSVLKLTSSNVTVPESLTGFWGTVTGLQISDDSKVILGAVPTSAVEVTAVCAGNEWNMTEPVITAPTGTAGNLFVLESPIDKALKFAEGEDSVSWTLEEASNNIGQQGTAGSALNIDLGLPEEDEFTPLDANATPYQTYLQKVEDLGEAKNEVKVIEPITVQGQYEIFVSPNGDDANIGSIDYPLATISKALDKVQVLQESLTDGVGGVVVYLREGTYTATESITLNAAHSGADGVPVIISAYNGEEVIISGGTTISGNDFIAVADETILEKLQDGAKDKIVQVDLKALGIQEFPTDPRKQMLVVDGEQFTLSRYPNATNLALTGKVLDIGRITVGYSDLGPSGTNSSSTGIEFEMTDLRPKSWDNSAGSIYLTGSLYAEWAIATNRVMEIRENSIKLEGGTGLGAKTSKSNTYYYFNILEELDVPGEYFVDKNSGILYLYPMGDMTNATVSYSVMQDDIIQLNNTKNVVLNDLTIENGAAYGVNMSGCEQTIVQNCVIRNVKIGVNIAGKKSGVIYSDIYNTAAMPAEISADQISFDYTPECNFLQNCYIYNTGTQNGKECCIYLHGTGNVISHNLIQGTYAASIYMMKAKECIVEYNEIVGGPTGLKDMGAIYMPYSPTATGNHIRYNYIHDIGRSSSGSNPNAIYLDEGSYGHFVYGNIISNVPRAFLTNSGSENVIINNIVLNSRDDAGAAFTGSDNFGSYTIAERFARSSAIETECNNYAAKTADEQAAIKNRYPLLAKFFENLKDKLDTEGDTYVGYFTAHDNYVANNLLYDWSGDNIFSFVGNNQTIENNTVLTVEDGDPFVDAANHDYSLKEGVSTSLTAQAPSMDKMGVQRTKKGIEAFTAYLPVDESQTVDPKEVLLKWTLADGADTYTLTIAADESFATTIKTVLLETPYIMFENDTDFAFDTPYYWKVVANSNAESRVVTAQESAVMSFRTMTEEAWRAANPMNFTELKEVITEAETFAAEAKEVTDGGLYYSGTITTLQSAIATSQQMVTNGENETRWYSEEDIALEIKALRNAINVAKSSRDVRTITFDGLNANDWSDLLKKAVTPTVVEKETGNELQMLYGTATGGYTEMVYNPGVDVRDILSFKYTQEKTAQWCGFAIAQSNMNVSITSAKNTDGYLICLFGGNDKNNIELQKRKGGTNYGNIAEVKNCAEIIKAGETHDIEIGAINNTDGSVRILFKVDGQVIFDHLDKNNAIVGETGFGIVVATSDLNGSVYLSSAQTQIEVTVDDLTAEQSGVIVAAPEGGWVEGTNTFTVAGENACVVAVKNEDGTYTRLNKNEESTEGVYSYTVENVTVDTEIVVAVAGDANGDGKVSNADITKLRAACAGKATLDGIQTLLGDVNGNGKVTNADITKLRAACAGKQVLNW